MPTREEILATEVKVLQAMCAGTLEGTVWDQGMLLLGPYPFQDVIHQLIFDTLQEINTDLPAIIRQQLAARLTRKGFPAVDTEKFLAPPGLVGKTIQGTQQICASVLGFFASALRILQLGKRLLEVAKVGGRVFAVRLSQPRIFSFDELLETVHHFGVDLRPLRRDKLIAKLVEFGRRVGLSLSQLRLRGPVLAGPVVELPLAPLAVVILGEHPNRAAEHNQRRHTENDVHPRLVAPSFFSSRHGSKHLAESH